MWLRMTLTAWAVLLLAQVPLHGQAPAGGNLLSQTLWCQFEVVRGRLTAMNARQAKTQLVTSEDRAAGEQQQLSFQVDEGLPCLRYRWIKPGQRLTVEIIRGNDITIHRESLGADEMPAVHFRQPPQGPLTLVVDRRTFQAPTIWHLLLDHPSVCEQHLLPALSLLRPHWGLAGRAEQVRESLHVWAGSDLPQREQFDALIQQLGDASFERRQAAARELRAVGQPILSYLEELDPAQLDAEQRVRIQQLCETLALCTADTPQRVGAWLVHSKSIWVVLLQDHDPARRQVAAAQLAKLTDGPLRFDPLATPEQRQEAIARLRSDLLR